MLRVRPCHTASGADASPGSVDTGAPRSPTTKRLNPLNTASMGMLRLMGKHARKSASDGIVGVRLGILCKPSSSSTRLDTLSWLPHKPRRSKARYQDCPRNIASIAFTNAATVFSKETSTTLEPEAIACASHRSFHLYCENTYTSHGCRSQVTLAGIQNIKMLYLAAWFHTLALIWMLQASSPNIKCVVAARSFRASPITRITLHVVEMFIHAVFIRHNLIWGGKVLKIRWYAASVRALLFMINTCGTSF